jgi:hypothetical protein
MKNDRTYKNCQSCGMPLRRDEKGGGTNTDGSKSGMYCSHCYEGGKFKQPNISSKEMQQQVKVKLREVGLPAPAAWLLTRTIPKLARWRKA